MSAQGGSCCAGAIRRLRPALFIRPQQKAQRLLTPGYGLGIGGKFALTLAKGERMNLVAAIDAHRGDDVVQELVIDDELDKRSWHKHLIEGRVDANQLLSWQVCPKANGACPRAATP